MAESRTDKVLEDANKIASTAIKQSGEMVSGAGEVLKGDVSGGVDHIVKAAAEIATNAAHQGTQIAKDLIGRSDEAPADEAPADDAS